MQLNIKRLPKSVPLNTLEEGDLFIYAEGKALNVYRVVHVNGVGSNVVIGDLLTIAKYSERDDIPVYKVDVLEMTVEVVS